MEKRESAGIHYFLNRRRGLRNLRLHVDHSGRVVVSAPYYISFSRLDEFVVSHLDWIVEHKQKLPQHTYETGDSIYFLGQKKCLEVVDSSFNNPTTISQNIIKDEKIMIYAKNKDIVLVQNEIKKLYVKTVFDILNTRVVYWSQVIDVDVPEYGVNKAKTKWGVCYPTQKRLYLSYMCAVLPFDLIDMTVFHEVCHLKVSGHGKPFWSLMETYMPDLNERKTRLKELSKTGISLHCV